MERLKMIKDNLISLISTEAMDLHKANCEELGAAIDMVKDISEAIYYCAIVKAMDKSEENSYNKRSKYSYPPIMYDGNSMRMNKKMYYHDEEYPRYYPEEDDWDMRDSWEGRSARSRRTYMEMKELHPGKDKDKQMRELEKYLNELSTDITEMISDASQEERDILSQKMTTLIEKIK